MTSSSSPHTNGSLPNSTIHSATEVVEPNKAPAAAAKPSVDEDLRSSLDQYRTDAGLKNYELGKELGFGDGTAVSRYLSRKPEGDVVGFEKRAADLLKGIARRSEIRVQLFETAVTRRLESVSATLGRIGGVGLLHGVSGVGKTCACQLHAMNNPLSLVLTVNAWDRSPLRVEGLIFEALDTRRFRRGSSKSDWMIDRLRGSRRPVVVDNAHRMTIASRRWLFDFAAQTACPLLLVGEPDLLSQIAVDQELASFVRTQRGLAFDGKDPAEQALEAARGMLGANASRELLGLATATILKTGSLRMLGHQVALMRDILATPDFAGGEVLAFESADTQMMRPTGLTFAQLGAPKKGAR